MNTPKEAALVYLVEEWLTEQGYETRLELQWRPQARTDLVGRREDQFVAVEVKVRDWRRALEQAVCQGMAFDHVYIAAQYSPSTPSLKEILEDTCLWTNWIGVLGIQDGKVLLLREPQRKPGYSSPHHRAIVSLQFMASNRAGQMPYEPKRSEALAKVH